MNLERNTYYVLSIGSLKRFCLVSLKDNILSLEFPYETQQPMAYRVHVEEDTKDMVVFDCYTLSNDYVGDLTLKRVTRSEPLLKTIGIDGTKCESDDEVDAYVYMHFNKSRKATIMKVKQ